MTTKQLKLGQQALLQLDQIKPYWRNPRTIDEEAVTLLMRSIEDYGYTQPIVVDEEYVIVVGHTRYLAMRRLGVEVVPVLIASELSPEQAKQYRLIDNRSAEFTSWEHESLTSEIEGLDADLLQAFFPEMFASDIDGFSSDGAQQDWARVNSVVGFTCPSCFHRWQVNVTREAIMSGVVTGAIDG